MKKVKGALGSVAKKLKGKKEPKTAEEKMKAADKKEQQHRDKADLKHAVFGKAHLGVGNKPKKAAPAREEVEDESPAPTSDGMRRRDGKGDYDAKKD